MVGLSITYTDVQNSACLEFLFVGVHERSGVTAKSGNTRLLYHILVVVTIVKDNHDELMQAAC